MGIPRDMVIKRQAKAHTLTMRRSYYSDRDRSSAIRQWGEYLAGIAQAVYGVDLTTDTSQRPPSNPLE